ncbi:AMP-binding protein [Motilimonas cestriensis]|uniref:AMP-binding protein n=1 Tax=Motilimonas cestriensis TaxID=2742685 RepID=A0ABS8WC46_9GAMM|nr:AMP-binding protein [Motilimonas cestriensis]MCE2596596.1 AMP-binding protein [Motilimonas cestriensis]
MTFAHPVSALRYWQQHAPEQVFLRQPQGDIFIEYTWHQVADESRRIASALTAMGFEPGERIAILAKNSAHWFIADLAIMLAGYVSVPIYASASSETIHYVLKHSETRAIFVGALDHWADQEKGIESDVVRIAMAAETMPAALQWSQLLKNNQPIAYSEQLDPNAKMSIVYTSGSTGEPKGVVMSFAGFTKASYHLIDQLDIHGRERTVSYLPLAHITERVYIQGTALFSGLISVSFVESLARFNTNLQSIKPTLFLSVPRLWLKFQQGIWQNIPPKKLDLLLKVPLLSRMVKNKIKVALGLEEARLLGCGSAAVSTELLRWYARLDIQICQAWGMSETLAYGTLNIPFNLKHIDSVGRTGKGAEIKVSEQGELLFKSDAMLTKYYLQPELTRQLYTKDGFIHTGDKAEIDDEGYVRITGRLKDMFKTAKGKYVMPVPTEAKFEDSSLVEQVCIAGDGLAQPVALLILSELSKEMDKVALEHKLAELLEHINERLESHERLAHLLILSDAWTPENGLLTPTLKIRRHKLEAKYKSLFMQADEKIAWY